MKPRPLLPLAVKYSRALLQLAQAQNQEEKVFQELKAVAALLREEEGQRLLTHPWLPKEKKIQLLDQLFGKQVMPLILSLLHLLVEKQRGGLLPDIVLAYQQAWQQWQGRTSAKVYTAMPLSPDQLTNLQQGLAKLMGQEVELEPILESGALAGARLEMEHWILDGTVAGRLQRLRQALDF